MSDDQKQDATTTSTSSNQEQGSQQGTTQEINYDEAIYTFERGTQPTVTRQTDGEGR